MFRPFLLVFCLTCLSAHAQPTSKNSGTAESEDEAMITQVEQMGKSMQDALAKVMEKFKGVTGSEVSAPPELNGLAEKTMGKVNKQVDDLNKLSEEIQ